METDKVKKTNKKIKLKKYHIGVGPRIAIPVIFMIIFIVAAAICINKAMATITVNQFFYSETSNLDYKTCYVPNTDYPEKCLDKGITYVASLIEYIETEFKYNFNASDLFNYKYKYSVEARVVASEKNNASKIVYDQKELLIEEKAFTMNNSSSFSIKENIKIDYIKYNELMKSFRNNYNLTLDSNLIITFYLSVDGDYVNVDDKVITDQNMTLTMPLSEQLIEIRMNYKDINNSELIKKETKSSLVNQAFYVLAAMLIIFTVAILIMLIRFINKITVSKSNYTKKLEKIMREYNQIIVETKSSPIIDESKVFEIDSFEELLDVRETVIKPILYIRVNNQKTYFIISNGEEVYRFVLKAVDLE